MTARTTKKPSPSKKSQGRKQKTSRTVTIPQREKVDFPEVKGKTLESVQLSLGLDDSGISLSFQDRTHLEFSIEPIYTVRTEFSNWKTGNGRRIKRWPVFRSESMWVK